METDPRFRILPSKRKGTADKYSRDEATPPESATQERARKAGMRAIIKKGFCFLRLYIYKERKGKGIENEATYFSLSLYYFLMPPLQALLI